LTKKGRGAGDAAEVGAFDVLGDSLYGGMAGEVVGEAQDVEREPLGPAAVGHSKSPYSTTSPRAARG
jgi:hypothetical protein